MPNYKGHLAGGVVVALSLVYVISWWLQPPFMIGAQWMVCALFGSLFPDIDTKSQGQLLTYRLLAVVLLVLVAQQRFHLALGCCAVALLPLVVHHRGLFHRVWFVTAVCLAIVAYAQRFFPVYLSAVALHTLFFYLGALSHIWLDLGLKRMWKAK